jgi:hypothetical protein
MPGTSDARPTVPTRPRWPAHPTSRLAVSRRPATAIPTPGPSTTPCTPKPTVRPPSPATSPFTQPQDSAVARTPEKEAPRAVLDRLGRHRTVGRLLQPAPEGGMGQLDPLGISPGRTPQGPRQTTAGSAHHPVDAALGFAPGGGTIQAEVPAPPNRVPAVAAAGHQPGGCSDQVLPQPGAGQRERCRG